MNIGFVLWLFDNVGLTDVKRTEIESLMWNNFWRHVEGNGIVSATTRMVGPDETIRPNRFDAVVFLTNFEFKGAGSIMKREHVDPTEAMGDAEVKGLTVAKLRGGGIAEVYWNRIDRLPSVASAVFHEACHLKFQEKVRDEMHNSVGPGGERVQVLGSHKKNTWLPNPADIHVFKSKIPNIVTLRTRMPQ